MQTGFQVYYDYNITAMAKTWDKQKDWVFMKGENLGQIDRKIGSLCLRLGPYAGRLGLYKETEFTRCRVPAELKIYNRFNFQAYHYII